MDPHPDSTEFKQAILSLERGRAESILRSSGASLPPIQVVEDIVVSALQSIGTDWEQGKLSLSQVYMSGRLCEELIDRILPPGAPERTDQPRMAIAVLEDHHALGKRMVWSALRAAGFELLDLGHGLQAEELVRRAGEREIRILLISTLMLRSALHIEQVAAGISRDGLPVQIIAGGAPFLFDDRLGEKVGARAVGKNCADAIRLVRACMEPAP